MLNEYISPLFIIYIFTIMLLLESWFFFSEMQVVDREQQDEKLPESKTWIKTDILIPAQSISNEAAIYSKSIKSAVVTVQ